MTALLEQLTPEDVKKAAACLSPADFAVYASGGWWKPARHLLLLNRYLLDAIAGKVKRLMVFMPPRHGKSELISHYLPACYLGMYPDHRVILASYEAGFAAIWGRKARRELEEYGEPLWGVQVDPTSSAADRWDIRDHRGGMITAGAGGPITGKGADLLICDDPVKNAEEAHSQVYREKTWDWWCSTAQTRIEPGGSAVLMHTRWHEDDLAGRLLKHEPEKWTVLKLPAIAEEADELDRAEGDALWPDRWGVEHLMDRKRAAGSYFWNALYQQRPAPEEGAIFRREWFNYFSNSAGTFKLGVAGSTQAVECDRCWRFSTVDLAASTKTSADYTVVSTWSVTPGNQLLLIDCVKARMEGPDQVPLLWRVYKKHNPQFIKIEKVGYQLSMIQAARRSGLPVQEAPVDKDKVSRALPAAARIESGDVFFPQDATWLQDFESELLSFPHGAHDDQVDTLSAAVQEVTKRAAVRFG
jgi:predicted phage terminase large subunit-like protein